MPSSIRISAAEQADIPHLERNLPQGGLAKHALRIARQERGEVVYLVAWHNERPVGQALLKWGGSGDSAVADRLMCERADIEDLRVVGASGDGELDRNCFSKRNHA